MNLVNYIIPIPNYVIPVLSYRNQFIDLQNKSVEWQLYCGTLVLNVLMLHDGRASS